MITIVACISSDSTTIAALWNAKTLDAASCWYQAGAADAAYVSGLLAEGYTIVLAKDGATPVGFGLWCGPTELPCLVALAADDRAVYYRLMAAYCENGIALGAVRGYAEIGTAPTAEKSLMDALGVIEYTPIGFEPVAPGEDTSERVAKLLRAECDLATLAAAIAQELGDSP